eukprot:CAMPEP_0197859832 /NCGR_PEP_ID=MMETSP1438-20131217/34767_1 /TAXON_ID=1461541 /ORGANISM="Pterosperma sp., Strain CCMP1384" /LENGTH=484 /DNA_ID=CAMNT_0043476491 /DNA_START=98 /DNA_END=1551 /DNA_ORIENTATION=-
MRTDGLGVGGGGMDATDRISNSTIGGTTGVITPGVESFDTKVTLVTTAVTDVQDGTFNSLAISGAMEACNDKGRCCLEIDVPHNTPRDYMCELEMSAQDSNLTIAVGFDHAAAGYQAARCNLDRRFAVVDVGYQSFPEGNIEGIVFEEAQGGYLAGIIAGMVARKGVYKRVGIVQGGSAPPVKRTVTGFSNAVAEKCSECEEVLVESCDDLHNLDNCGVIAAKKLLAIGVDVLFGAGGQTGSQAILYAAAPQGSEVRGERLQCPSEGGAVKHQMLTKEEQAVYVVGMGADEFNTTFVQGHLAGSNMVLTSAMKRTDQAVKMTIANFLGGMASGRNYHMNVANEGVAYAPCHLSCFINGGPVTNDITAEAQRVRALMTTDEFDHRVGQAGQCLRGPGLGCPSTSNNSNKQKILVGVTLSVSIFAVLLMGFVITMIVKERHNEPMFSSLEEGGSEPAVSIAMSEIPNVQTQSSQEFEPRTNPMLSD